MQIFNSLSNKKEEFVPLKKGRVGMYVCGPTVYDEPHIGHARSAYVFDVIRRYFTYRKFKVTFVRNVTDVDDKIIEKARQEYKGQDLKEAVSKVSRKYLKVYRHDMAGLGILKPDEEPKATEYIEEMIEFIKILLGRGVAYASGGDVYFDITKAGDYGKLSNQSVDRMKVGARILPGENKKYPLDFALWKKAKGDEPSWPSPWGQGRPGWHIECSVMSSRLLGSEFDIHAGGIDLIFPHHENEIAQSEGAGGKFARYWIHNGLLTINGEKMAKSLGNFITIENFVKGHKYPNVLKFFFLSAHYSHPIDYTDKNIEDAKKTNERLFIMLAKVRDIFRGLSPGKEKRIKTSPTKESRFSHLKEEFERAMDDDFNTPQALAALQRLIIDTNITVTEYHRSADKDISLQQLYYSCNVLLPEIAGVFGLDLNIPPEMEGNLDEGIEMSIKKRDEARKNKDFKLSDKIRRELEEKGIILEDTKKKTTWRRRLS